MKKAVFRKKQGADEPERDEVGYVSPYRKRLKEKAARETITLNHSRRATHDEPLMTEHNAYREQQAKDRETVRARSELRRIAAKARENRRNREK